MSIFPLKPTHAPVKAYYAALAQFHLHGHTTEGNTRSAFADLLKKCCSPYGWHLVEEYQFKGTSRQSLRADGALVDELTLVHGLWEAKDSDDDLQAEIKKKVAAGYPLTNILFQSPTRAVLYQGSRKPFDGPIDKPEALIEVLELFFEHRQAHEVDWEEAVFKFAEKVPDLARGVTTILEAEDNKIPAFRENVQCFAKLCRQRYGRLKSAIHPYAPKIQNRISTFAVASTLDYITERKRVPHVCSSESLRKIGNVSPLASRSFIKETRSRFSSNYPRIQCSAP